MPSSIKSQIMSAIMQALATVPSPQNRIKVVRPNNDYTAQGTTVLPELIVIPGPEAEQARDAIGQTYQFDVHVKIWVPHAPPPTPRTDYQHEEIAAAVIQALEDPKLLSGLGTLVLGAEEQSFLRSGLSKIKGPFIRLRIQYSRRRGDPYTTYVPDATKQISGTTEPVPMPATQMLEVY
jgi:hypothetical protein